MTGCQEEQNSSYDSGNFLINFKNIYAGISFYTKDIRNNEQNKRRLEKELSGNRISHTLERERKRRRRKKSTEKKH